MPVQTRSKGKRPSKMSSGAVKLAPLKRGTGHWTQESVEWSREQQAKDEESFRSELKSRGKL